MRNVLFYGNCYAGNLNGIYSSTIAPLNGDVSSYLSSYEEGEDSERRIAAADIIVQQVFDVDQKVGLDFNAIKADVIRFPTVSLGFLWPYGLVPHIKNDPTPYWQCGPYDYLFGDNYLNRKFDQGIPPEEAVADYLSLDIAKRAHLDRLKEIMLDKQRARDATCGMDFADEVEASFRSEYLFLNPYRPNARMASLLAEQVYTRLGIPADTIAAITARWRKTPFERTALPIHPRVAEHFDLTYGHAGTRYLYHTGEMLTFEDFVRRYSAFQCNERLLKGVATVFWAGNEVFREFQQPVSDQRVDEALADVTEGLATSNGSALGERAMAALLLRGGRQHEALAALDRAITFDPSDAEAHFQRGVLLENLGRIDGAIAAFSAAKDQDPTFHPAYGSLASLLESRQRPSDALALLKVATELQPANGFYAYDLARMYAITGGAQEARDGFVRAIDLLPTLPGPKIRLAELLLADDEHDLVEKLVRDAVAQGAHDGEVAHLRGKPTKGTRRVATAVGARS